MRMFLKVSMETQAGSRAIADGSMAAAIKGFVDTFKPEGVWFTALDGKRAMVSVFDLPSAAQLPAMAEPFFSALGAHLEISPAMDLADLQSGLASV